MTVMTRAVARLLLAPSWMIAAAVMVKAYADTGDGFSAGVIASLGVLLQYLAFGAEAAGELPPVRYARQLALAGLILALAVVFVPVVRGEAVLTHWPVAGASVSHLGSLEVLTAVAFDVGVFLLVFGFMIGTFDLIAQLTERLAPPERGR